MKYKIDMDNEILSKKEWEEKVLNDLDHILEYQELPQYAKGTDGKSYHLGFEITTFVEEN